MIYGDKKYKENEIRYPDILAVFQSSNLYGYCIGNPLKYIDITGEQGKEYIECEDKSNNYYSYENSLGKHTVTSNNYCVVDIADSNSAINMEDKIAFDYNATSGNLFTNFASSFLPSVVGNICSVFDSLESDRIYDVEDRPLHIERGYTVRINTIYL